MRWQNAGVRLRVVWLTPIGSNRNPLYIELDSNKLAQPSAILKNYYSKLAWHERHLVTFSILGVILQES